MTTKEQERKALEKIRKIVEEVGGKDSYIGMAFEGCFEIAETNIDNDWGCSMQQKIDQMSNSLEASNLKYAEVQQELIKANGIVKDLDKQLEQCNAKQEKTMEDLSATQAKLVKASFEIKGLNDDIAAAENTIAEKDHEIMMLKARLFDLLYANKETA